MFKILAINPGSTSTKIALYEDEKEVFKKNIEHTNDELEKYDSVAMQYKFRYEEIINSLKKEGIDINKLDSIVARGGLLPPVKSGAYEINEAMIDRLVNRPLVEHASNLGAIIAYHIAKPLEIKSYIYDSVSVDELQDIARISGVKEINRKSFIHALNMRSVAIKYCKEENKKYDNSNLIVAHLGGGISISLHSNGKMIDIVSDDEGAFSPERAGKIPCRDLVKMCYSQEKSVVDKKMRGKGGLVSYLETNSALDVEAMIDNGNEYAKLVYEAMAYQIAKGIGEMAVAVDGEIDAILITGGIAYSKRITEWVKKRVKFIAPVCVIAGENELQALAYGGLRVLKNEETAHLYDLD